LSLFIDFVVIIIISIVVPWQASEITLTVYNKPTLRQLNSAAPPCGLTSWQYAVPQVVTNTSGCSVIGVVVADFETDVVHVESGRHWPLLYLGHINIASFVFLFNRSSGEFRILKGDGGIRGSAVQPQQCS